MSEIETAGGIVSQWGSWLAFIAAILTIGTAIGSISGALKWPGRIGRALVRTCPLYLGSCAKREKRDLADQHKSEKMDFLELDLERERQARARSDAEKDRLKNELAEAIERLNEEAKKLKAEEGNKQKALKRCSNQRNQIKTLELKLQGQAQKIAKLDAERKEDRAALKGVIAMARGGSDVTDEISDVFSRLGLTVGNEGLGNGKATPGEKS